jgi:hypothetical protein
MTYHLRARVRNRLACPLKDLLTARRKYPAQKEIALPQRSPAQALTGEKHF